MFEIFINDTKLILSWKKIKKIRGEEYNNRSQIVYIVKSIFDGLIKEDYCLYSIDIAQLYQDFVNSFKFIRAAGGLVFNKNRSLWIFRNNKWDLPKGGIEEGEELEYAAIREVNEECGLDNIYLESFLGSSLHMYFLDDKIILKEVIWYKMYSKNEELIPQIEEGITKAEWKTKQEHIDILNSNSTYLSIKKFLKTNKNYFFD